MTDLFIKILNMSAAASWIILAVLVLRQALKQAPKWVRVLLWGLAALRLLCPFSVESVMSLIPSAKVISPEILLDTTPTLQTGISSVDQAVNQVIAGTNTPAVGASVNPLQVTFALLTLVWVIGAFVMLVYALISYLALSRTVRTAVRTRDNIYQSERIDTPFVLGIFRPRIYLPYTISEKSMDHVLAHEKAHIRRKDHWWKPFGFLLLTVHWFNPLVWLAYILLCRDIELACDEKVIKEMGVDARADYSAALLSCSTHRHRIAACPVAFGEVSVKKRIKSVLHYKKPALWVILIALVLCVIVAVCFLTNPIGSSGAPDLSFLSYENAMSLVIDREEVQAIYCPPSQKGADHAINMGAVNGKDLAVYLDNCDWRTVKAPNSRLSSPGSIEFVIAEDHRIQIYQRKGIALYGYAVVTFGEDMRYYAIGNSDYRNAVNLLYTPKASAEESLWKVSRTGDSYYLTVGCEGVAMINISTPTSGSGCMNADGSLFQVGEKVWLEQLEGIKNLDGVKIQASDTKGNILYMVSLPVEETDHKWMTGTVLDIADGYFLVDPVEDMGEEQVLVPMEHMEASPEPEIGDLLQIEFLGKLLDSQPAKVDIVRHISVLKDSSEQTTIVPTSSWTDGITFADLRPNEERISNFDIVLVNETNSFEYSITWARTGLTLEYGLRSSDGAFEHCAISTGGQGNGQINQIPAGTYHLFVRNTDYTGVPAYDDPDQFPDTDFNATGAINFRIP